MERLLQLWADLRSSLWFVPATIVLIGVGLAVGLISLDALLAPESVESWHWLLLARAEGARSMLSAIATSMITVAGVVFSITIVALSLAASQYTSRVLRNFMRDRMNQTVLGVFVGIFAYYMIVLRTIRGGEESYVPQLAVLFGLVLAFVGLAFFVLFVHHIAWTIQASNILASIAADTVDVIDYLFPDHLKPESCPVPPAETSDNSQRTWFGIAATTSGYIQRIDAEQLLKFAQQRDALLRLEHDVGEFVVEGRPIISIAGAPINDPKTLRQLGKLFIIGTQRTSEQDVSFGIGQIVDVALKALSTGINETTTAVMCVNHLEALLLRLATREIVSGYHTDDGQCLIIGREPTFRRFLSEAFDDIRRNARGNYTVLARLLEAMRSLCKITDHPERCGPVADQIDALARVIHRTIEDPAERAELAGRAEALAHQAVNRRAIGS